MMTEKNILVLDLETQKSFKEVGKSRLDKLKISVLGLYDYRSKTLAAYEEKEILGLEKRFREADLVVGFNIRRFDLPVLAPYLLGTVEDLPVLDLLDEIEQVRGHRVSLDSIAGPTLKKHKIGTGADALMLYKENRMEELKRYCLEDVRLTKEIYDYGCREGKVYFTSSWDYKTYEIPVRWDQKAREQTRGLSSQSGSFPSSLF